MNIHILRVALAAALMGLSLEAQMTNDATGSLVINGVTGASPLEAALTPGGSLDMTVSGNPNVPYVLGFAPDVEINATVYAPGLSLDIGPAANVVVLMDGTASPAANFWNAFANTGPAGVSHLVFPIAPSAPPGLIGALQAFLIDFSTPTFVKATAATRLVVRHPFPDLLFTANQGPGTGDQASLLVPGATPVNAAGIGLFNFQDIGLRKHGELYRNEGSFYSTSGAVSAGGIHRRRPPTAHEPRWFSEDSAAPRIRTVHGDIYAVRDVITGDCGYMRITETTVEVIQSSMRAAIGGTVNPWKALVAVDGGVMAAVEATSVGADRIHLIRIDGGVWSTTGTAVRDVTPTVAAPNTIYAESLVLWNDVLFFTGQLPTGEEPLYRADAPSAAVAAQVTLPVIMAGVPATFTSKELFLDEVHQTLYSRVGETATLQRSGIQRITNIVAGTPATVTTITAFSLLVNPMAVLEFGRAHDGSDGRFAVSPDGQKIAFVVRRASATVEEVMIQDLTTNVVSEVTDNARFSTTTTRAKDLAWATNDRLLFWYGLSATQLDLYGFDLIGGGITNITGTNGQSGAVLPIFVGSLSRVNPRGQVMLADRLLFYRGGTPVSGTIIAAAVRNLCAVDRSTLALTNVTGDEFAGPGTTTVITIAPAFAPALAETGSVLWWAGTKISQQHELFSYDTAGPFVTGTPHVLTSPSSNSRIRAIEPRRDGSGCWFVETYHTVNGGTAILEAPHSGTKTVIVPANLATEHLDILPFPTNAQHAGFFTVRMFSTGILMAPDSQAVAAFDETTGLLTDLTAPVTAAISGAFVHLLSQRVP